MAEERSKQKNEKRSALALFIKVSVAITITISITLSIYSTINLSVIGNRLEALEKWPSQGWKLEGDSTTTELGVKINKDLDVDGDISILNSTLELAGSSCLNEVSANQDSGKLCFDMQSNQFMTSEDGANFHLFEGKQGEQGPAGSQAERGLQGAQGPAGSQGERGLQGAQGQTGSQGERGPQGAQGPAGRQGEKGDPGAAGIPPTGGIQLNVEAPDNWLTLADLKNRNSFVFSNPGNRFEIGVQRPSGMLWKTFMIYTNGNVEMAVNSGNVGIGHSNPSSKLVVADGFNHWINIGANQQNPRKIIDTSSGAFLRDDGTWVDILPLESQIYRTPLIPSSILNRLIDLPITLWSLKEDALSTTHIGPSSSSFYEAFGIGAKDESIDPRDVSAVALISIKALHELGTKRDLAFQEVDINLKLQGKEIDRLKAKIEILMDQLKDMSMRTEELERKIEDLNN